MTNGSLAPVLLGLVAGIVFLFGLSIVVLSLPEEILLSEQYDLEGQWEAVRVLLSNPEAKQFIEGKNFEVWAYGNNYPQESLNEGVCEKNECTLIGLRERNADGSTDCAILTYVNVETQQIDMITYFAPCDVPMRS